MCVGSGGAGAGGGKGIGVNELRTNAGTSGLFDPSGGPGSRQILGGVDLGNGTARIYYKSENGITKVMTRPYEPPKKDEKPTVKPAVKPVTTKPKVTDTGKLPSNKPGYGTPNGVGNLEPGRLFPSRGALANDGTASFGERYYQAKKLGGLNDTIARFGTDANYIGSNLTLGAA